MLKGDLTTTPLAPLLLSLAEEESTGCLHVSDVEGDEALIYFKTGLVYAVFVPGRRPQLGAKLVSSGALTPEALAEALDAQRTELQGWKLGELLVHLGFVDQPVVEAFVREQVHDAVWDLIRWTEGRWRFRKNEKTREDVAPPMTVQELLENLRERGVEWEAISGVVHGPTAVPVLSARGGGAPETTLDADAWSMLCKIDGERSVAELARDCGYTLFEAGQVLVTLVQAGLVDIEEDLEVVPMAPVVDEGDELYGASEVMSALTAALAPEPVAAEVEVVEEPEPAEPLDNIAEIARLVSEVAAGIREDEDPEPVQESPSQVSIRPVADDDSFALSVDRVSAALADVLGPAPEGHDPFEVPAEMRVKKAPQKKSRLPERTPESDRREALRAAAAAELAAAHALAEALRRERESADQQAVEEAAQRAAEEAAAKIAAAEEAARLAAEEEAARVAAEEAEAARIAAEEEAARVAAEQEEAARIAAEQEEAARVAAEEAEAARIAAEEEAARVAAEQEEAARVAAEEAEAARIAAEEEAARVAAEEAEAARVAAEEAEAARIAAEQEEAARVAAEQEEAARVAAEEAEAARIAAEEEAARLLAEEIATAEDEAWGEYWTREAEDLARREADAERAAADEAERLAAEEAARVAAEDQARAQAEDDERAASLAEADERERRSNAAALLAEFATQVSASPEPVAEVTPEEPDPASDDDLYDEPAELEPVAATVGAPGNMADTAALLRELSSLGVDDDAPPAGPPAPRAPMRPPAAAPAAKPKKKRGLFGL